MGMDEAIAARIRMITEAGDGLSGPDLLGFALDHAVTETGGLGGMVHLRGPGARSPRLTAVHGLIRPVARDWAEVEAAGASAPAAGLAGAAEHQDGRVSRVSSYGQSTRGR
ncbi:hypothetical protein [Streptomyces sp. DASNCL29]|uniref:hypothetical protein n=1 Tax=Streptomyces sp. DASNCL29 TaxID=2583819 RepID=UPI0019D294BE|nr:hypothetical protein [Streptomyces sp. DASNCL29]